MGHLYCFSLGLTVPSFTLDYEEREMEAMAFCLSLASDIFFSRLNFFFFFFKKNHFVSLLPVLNLLTEGIGT